MRCRCCMIMGGSMFEYLRLCSDSRLALGAGNWIRTKMHGKVFGGWIGADRNHCI